MKKRIREVLEFLLVGPLFSILKALNRIEGKLDTMATQAEVDALTAKVGDVGTTLARGLGEVQTEIQSLKDQLEAGQPIDLSALSATIDGLVPVADALDNVVAEVIPEPEPEQPEPVDPEQV